MNPNLPKIATLKIPQYMRKYVVNAALHLVRENESPEKLFISTEMQSKLV